MLKTCNRCGQEKPADAFNKDANKGDGLHTICKGCRQKPSRRVWVDTPLGRVTQRGIDRFWAAIEVGAPNECWNWTGVRVRNRYGLSNIVLNGQRQVAHRFAWILMNDQLIPDGLYACHTCDNPACCNPLHVFLSDQKGNMDDMFRKGRDNHARGERAGNAKLSDADVARLRTEFAERKLTQRQLAKRYNVHITTVSKIVQGKSRADAGGEIAPDRLSLNAKLTPEKVLEIRSLYATGNYTQLELSERYGVSETLVGQIANRRIWKHI